MGLCISALWSFCEQSTRHVRWGPAQRTCGFGSSISLDQDLFPGLHGKVAPFHLPPFPSSSALIRGGRDAHVSFEPSTAPYIPPLHGREAPHAVSLCKTCRKPSSVDSAAQPCVFSTRSPECAWRDRDSFWKTKQNKNNDLKRNPTLMLVRQPKVK